MSLRIATNVQALSTQRVLGINHHHQNQSLERLASGTRINRAGDDAAGLAISEKLKSKIRSMSQALRNANDGVSLVQVAEGAMNEVGNVLIRLRELSIQAASDTIGDTERSYIDKEVQHLKEEVNRIALSTEFNGTKLLDGSGDKLDIQIGIENDPQNDRLSFDAGAHKVTVDALGLGDVSTMNKELSQENLSAIDKAIDRMNENRSALGALQNRLGSTINNLSIYRENLSLANSRIRDTDMAEETSELAKYNVLTQSNVAMLGQANSNPQLALKLL